MKPPPATRLALSVRTYTCDACGLILDRDLNAAINLPRLDATVPEWPETGAARLERTWSRPKTGPARQVAVKRLPRTTPVGKTGTARW